MGEARVRPLQPPQRSVEEPPLPRAWERGRLWRPVASSGLHLPLLKRVIHFLPKRFEDAVKEYEKHFKELEGTLSKALERIAKNNRAGGLQPQALQKLAENMKKLHVSMHYAVVEGANPKAAERFLKRFCERHYKTLGYQSASACVKQVKSEAAKMLGELKSEAASLGRLLSKLTGKPSREELMELARRARSMGLPVRLVQQPASEELLKNYCHGNEVLVFTDKAYQCKNGKPEEIA